MACWIDTTWSCSYEALSTMTPLMLGSSSLQVCPTVRNRGVCSGAAVSSTAPGTRTLNLLVLSQAPLPIGPEPLGPVLRHAGRPRVAVRGVAGVSGGARTRFLRGHIPAHRSLPPRTQHARQDLNLQPPAS